MHYRLGRYEEALGDLARARELARQDGDAESEVDILLDEATVLDWMESFRASEARVEEAAARAEALVSKAIRARLLLGLGRSHHRFSREAEARALLVRAVAAAEELADEGYETLVVALLMLGFILPGLGRLDEAERVLERAIAASKARGDRLHLFAALNNRALAFGYRGDKSRMLATFEHALDLAGELGQLTMELVAQFNLGEYLYLMDDVERARPHIERAAEAERRLFGDAGRPVVALLRARVRLHEGDLDGARAIIIALRAGQGEARARGQTETLLMPSEDVLCAAVELGLRDGSDAEWRDVEDRASRVSVGQERIEVREIHARFAVRCGRRAQGRRLLEQAIALSASIPNVLGEHLRGELLALDRAQSLGLSSG